MTNNFNDAIFAKQAFKQFVAQCAPLSAFSRDFNSESEQPGQVIYVPRVEALTATTFSYSDNSGFPYANSGGVINTVTVTLDQQFIVTADSTDLQRANSSAGLDLLAQNMGDELSKKVWQRIATLFTTVNFGLAAANISIETYGRATTVSVRTVMAKRDVNVKRCSFIVNEDVMTSWLSDATLYQVYSSGLPSIQSGSIPALAGMKVYDVNIMPTNGISLVGVCAHPDSVALACRYLTPQGPEVMQAAFAMTDPESGIVMGYRKHYSPDRGKAFVNIECLFGMAVGLSLGLGILTRTN
jgi:hypothetical protein